MSMSENIVIQCSSRGPCNTKRCKCLKYQVKCTNYCHSGAEHTACENFAQGRAQNIRPLRKRNLSPTTQVEAPNIPVGIAQQNEFPDGDVIHVSS